MANPIGNPLQKEQDDWNCDPAALDRLVELFPYFIVGYTNRFFLYAANVQNGSVNNYIHTKLKDIQAVTSKIQRCEITVKRQGADPIDGTILFADAAKELFSVLNGDTVRWEGVNTARIENIHHQQSGGSPLPFQDHYNYKIGIIPFLQEDFYKNVPPEQLDWIMMLLTDAFMMYAYKLLILDNLEYDKSYQSESMKNNALFHQLYANCRYTKEKRLRFSS